MYEFIDTIALYKEDWEDYKAQCSYIKESTNKKIRTIKAKVAGQVSDQRLVFDILDLYQDRQPLWMRLIKYRPTDTLRIKSKDVKKLSYDASIDDDEKSDTSSYLAEPEPVNHPQKKNIKEQLDDICAELEAFKDNSSSVYGEYEQYNHLVGENPYKEAYTYI